MDSMSDPGRADAARSTPERRRRLPRLPLLAALLAVWVVGGFARAETAPREVVLEVFTRTDCPHCAAAHEFLTDLVARTPGLRVVDRDVVRDAVSRARLESLCAEAGVHPPGVPAFHVDGRLLVGFDDAETTGRELESRIAIAAGRAPPAEPSLSQDTDTIELPLFGRMGVRELGLPLFTIAIGILDGVNPCAMWVLLFLLSLLAHVRSRTRMILVGGTFVVTSGLVYFAFLAAWLNAFRFVGFSRTLQIGLGLVATALGALSLRDALAGSGTKTLGIPETAKPGIYERVRRILRAESLVAALASVTLLAVFVNAVELLCTAGLPALYTHVLSRYELSHARYAAYLGLYVAFYMLDDAVMLTLAVVTLGGRKLDARSARILTAVSGAVMLALGIALVLRPGWWVTGG